jgi:hypothetical protein
MNECLETRFRDGEIVSVKHLCEKRLYDGNDYRQPWQCDDETEFYRVVQP